MSTIQQPVMGVGQTVFKPVVKETGATGLVSIVVPCFGQMEHTKICVPRILKYSRGPFEVIFVDVATLDGTAEYLAGVTAIPGVRAEVVQASPDIRLPEAWSAGLERAEGEYIVFVSNDTVVCERWLNHLVAAAKVAGDVGMVGTMSNMAAGKSGGEKGTQLFVFPSEVRSPGERQRPATSGRLRNNE